MALNPSVLLSQCCPMDGATFMLKALKGITAEAKHNSSNSSCSSLSTTMQPNATGDAASTRSTMTSSHPTSSHPTSTSTLRRTPQRRRQGDPVCSLTKKEVRNLGAAVHYRSPPWTLRCLERVLTLQKATLFVDIGAGDGATMMAMQQHMPSISILGVEKAVLEAVSPDVEQRIMHARFQDDRFRLEVDRLTASPECCVVLYAYNSLLQPNEQRELWGLLEGFLLNRAHRVCVVVTDWHQVSAYVTDDVLEMGEAHVCGESATDSHVVKIARRHMRTAAKVRGAEKAMKTASVLYVFQGRRLQVHEACVFQY